MWCIFVETKHKAMKQKYLTFKWTVSRGRNTYGYNICSLYVDGKKVASCNGGGYDMQGTALGNWLEKEFQEQLKTLVITKYYGLTEYEGVRYLDGACGFSSMEKVVDALGYKLERLPITKSKESYYVFKQI
jgi:hypothetical protein